MPADRQQLWPPNHAMHEISLLDCIAAAVDDCDGELDAAAASRIVGVTCADGEGGCASGDMVITSDTTALVRAERAGRGNGRLYSIAFVVRDAAGNETPGSCEVAVAHDRR